MALLILPDGTSREVRPNDGAEKFGLEQLQALVGGYIEVIYAADGAEVIVNEEGKLDGLEPNPTATEKLRERLFPGDYIAGPAVFCAPGEVD